MGRPLLEVREVSAIRDLGPLRSRTSAVNSAQSAVSCIRVLGRRGLSVLVGLSHSQLRVGLKGHGPAGSSFTDREIVLQRPRDSIANRTAEATTLNTCLSHLVYT